MHLLMRLVKAGPKIIKGFKKSQKDSFQLLKQQTQANLALSSGFSADQIRNLAEISLKASRALGRDLTDSLTV